MAVDHEASAQPYRPVEREARHGCANQAGLQPGTQTWSEYDLTTQDEEQTDKLASRVRQN